MEENMEVTKNEIIEDDINTVEELVQPENTVPNEDIPTIPYDGAETIPPMPMEGNEGFNMPLSGIGGNSDQVNEVFNIQKQIFENINTDINDLKEYRTFNTKEVGYIKDSLTATKLYTKLLSKAIFVTDVVFLIAIILLIIFK